jgi:CRISPR-associated endonuclease Csn1
MKTILGLDLGTNSIGWALVEQDFENKKGKILGMGSRIIPMSQDVLGEFGKGNSVSQTAERTAYRSSRRLRERYLLRRERLHRVLNILSFLPEHYASQIDFEKCLGKFKQESEPKLAYKNKEFIFKMSFNEMLADFHQYLPQILVNEKGVPKLIPYDWTIYFLRKKALTKKIEKEELAWIILNFNQKRGYYQLRGEEEEEDNPNKLVEFHSLRITDIIADETQKNKTDVWYSLVLENGWVYRRQSKTPLFDWKGKTRDFIVTTDLNSDGTIKTDKEGNEKRSFRAPSEDDWTLLKKKTEQEIDKSDKTVGVYIYDSLLKNPKQKIKGKLVRTIERKFYKEELRKILKKQIELQPELFTTDLYDDCIRELYRNNEAHQLLLSKRDFIHLFLEDIIFYQRPLRSQKSSINNCSLEFRTYKDENGIKRTEHLKAIPKSNPYYQEFRIWQWIYNLSIYRKDDDTDVTAEFLNGLAERENLFDFLNNRKAIEQKLLIKYFLEHKGLKGKPLTIEIGKYRWNYVEDKEYPCNETRTLIRTKLEKVKNISDGFLTKEMEQSLWHLIYSVTDKHEYEKALKSFTFKHNLDETSFVDAFKKFPPFKSEYGSFSEKAIKRLLPLLRHGKYWNWDNIDKKTQYRINQIIDAEVNDEIKQIVRDKADKHQLREKAEFQGLPLWLSQYIVYDRHSEAAVSGKWNSSKDLEDYLKEFKQHSLRNPIVEQVITETLRVVKDIWTKYGNGTKNFFDEIHIELGREMKNTAEDRKEMTKRMSDNENTNLRIKALLAELKNDPLVENVRPYSPMQQEILKIFEDGILNSDIEIEDEILKISATAQPSSADLKRYKLWLEQKYRSPYTGEIIPLTKLFTPEYEIEHIIPQSRYFDDSLGNKVICEAAVNSLKDNQTGLEFIKNHRGEKVQVGMGRSVQILDVKDYENFVKQHFVKNRSKRNKLLMEDIPEKMIERQLNDTRYVSKFICNLLSNIVRGEKNDDGVNSKNIIPGNGKITSELKQDWGLNDIWNELILPRFERMNHLMNTTQFTVWNELHQKFLPTVPLELSKGFSKKRIDHRHHALDALIIACATSDHVNYMNNEHALRKGKTKDEKQKIRYDLKTKLCDKRYNKNSNKDYEWIFKKPWNSFTIDAKNILEHIVVSVKQNLRVINKATNYYEKWVAKNGIKVKEKIEQKGSNWAIRKQLHQETVSGKVLLSRIKIPSGKILTATRKHLDTTFDFDKIEKITDTGIQKILRNHLKSKENNPEIAFSPEGIENMNKDIAILNENKFHQPILKVRAFEIGSRFILGNKGNKKSKYVQTKEGTNLFFAIYQDEEGKRNFETIPINEVIEHQKWRASLTKEIQAQTSRFPLKKEKGEFLFCLSPDDLVYVPTIDELNNNSPIDFANLSKDQKNRLYLVNDFSSTCYFRPNRLAKAIRPKEVDMNYDKKKEKVTGSFDTKTASLEGNQIKDICIKLRIDRLGNISKA